MVLIAIFVQQLVAKYAFVNHSTLTVQLEPSSSSRAPSMVECVAVDA